MFLLVELGNCRKPAILMEEGTILLSENRKIIHDLKEAWAEELMFKI